MTWGLVRLLCQKWSEGVDLDILDGFLMERYRTILDAHPWRALEVSAALTLTTGTAGTRALYSLPAALKILLEVNNISPSGGGFPLRPYTQPELNMVYPARPDVGQPFIYSMAEDSSGDPPVHMVEVYPIPSSTAAESAMPYRYITIPPNFSPTNTTASPLPWIPPRLIIEGVRADLSLLAKDEEASASWETRFTAGINDLLTVELHRQPNARLAELTRYEGVSKYAPPPRTRK